MLLLVEKETYEYLHRGVETPGGCVGCLGGQTVTVTEDKVYNENEKGAQW